MLNRNPGLREICHSITGGALVAQGNACRRGPEVLRLLIANTGYWMPFEAAKAMAATFCWRIRYALTLVFGIDFPTMCLRPESEGFGTMVLDPAITRRCAEEAIFYRQLDAKASPATVSVMRSPLTPESPTSRRQVKQLRPKARRLAEAASSYTSDSSFEDRYSATSLSPTIPSCNTWTPANTPRSIGPQLRERLLSPREISAEDETDRRSARSTSTSSTTSLLLKSRQEIMGEEAEDDNDVDEYGDGAESSPESPVALSNLHEIRGRRLESPLMSDEKAAYLLLRLNMEAGFNEALRGEKRRASA
jgi:hypothetical protein